jgi:high affinity sulfate transporter 1
MAIYAVLGSSRPLSMSTTTTLAILSAAELEQGARSSDPAFLASATATLSLLVGLMLIMASVVRLGFVAAFISDPVLVGFMAGIGVVIVVDQVPKILGLHFPRGTFLQNLLTVAHRIEQTSVPTLFVGLAMLILLVGIQRFLPKAPAALVAVTLGIAGAWLFDWRARGIELVGQMPRGLPPLTRPDSSLGAEYWAGALGIALMSFTETIAAGRAFVKSGEPALQANRELFAVGLANAGGAFFGSMPAGGGVTQTAVNRRAGARTQLAEVVTAGVSLATMLLLAPLIALLPQATLAAVVITSAIGLIQPAEFRAILKVRRTEFIWALVAFAGVVSLGTLRGIVVAIAVSLIALAHQATNPPVYVLGRKRGTNVFRPRSKKHPDDETFPGLLLLRLEGRVFFANAGHISQKIRPLIEAAQPKIVAIDLSGVPDLEYTALKMLIEAEKQQRERGVSVWLVGLTPTVLAMVQRSPLGKTLGREALYFNLQLAVAKYLKEAA